MTECLPSMHETLDLILSSVIKKQMRKQGTVGYICIPELYRGGSRKNMSSRSALSCSEILSLNNKQKAQVGNELPLTFFLKGSLTMYVVQAWYLKEYASKQGSNSILA